MNKKIQDKIKKLLAYEEANVPRVPGLIGLDEDIPKQVDRTNPTNVKLVKDILLSKGFIQASEHKFTKDAWDIHIYKFAYHINFTGARIGLGTHFNKFKNILDVLENTDEDSP